MQYKILFGFMFLIGAVLNGLNAQTPQVVLELKWGSGIENAGFRKAPEANYGPRAFAVKDGQVVILDEPQNLLKIFKNGRLLRSFEIPPFSDDVEFNSADDFVILAENRLYFFKNGRIVNSVKPPTPMDVIEAIKRIDANHLQITFSDQSKAYFPLNDTQLLKKAPASAGNALSELKTVKLDEHTFRLETGSGQTTYMALKSEEPLASVRYLGSDDLNRHYLNLEFFEQQVPLRVRREIRVLDSQFRLLATIHAPVNAHTEIFRDWFIEADGHFYQMISGVEGIKIVKWDLTGVVNADQPLPLRYPQPFFEGVHYNLLDTQDAGSQLSKVSDFEDYPQIMPSEALAIADEYVRLYWTCTQDNLTNGVVTDPYGNQVRTPSWIVVGQNQHVPYKWGGSESIEAFLYGIEILKYAGDNYTDGGGTPSAVGVDCSGFVSRCWNLPRHYATSMMDDGITLPYLSWSEAEPGDAVHKVGHVRMVVRQNTNGSLLVVESSGQDWKVSYRTYYYSSLVNYTPRYYVNRQGAPDNIPQPRLNAVTINEKGELELDWSLEGLENVSSLRIYFSTDGNSWGSGISVPKDTTQWSVPINDGQMIFVKLRSFSSGAYQNPSVSSDVYGGFRNDGMSRVLIVDGFDRTSATSGRWQYLYHSFATTLGKSLAAAGIPFETTTNEMVRAQNIDLENYPAVFWLCGDESIRDGTFDREEQLLVTDYLLNGGRLFVSGSEIGYDLGSHGTAYDQTFFSDYLKAAFVKDNAGSWQAEGATGTPFAGLQVRFDDGLQGIYPVSYPDAVSPQGGAQLALKYANGDGAAVYFDGVFPNGSRPARLFYLGFPFETIYDAAERDSLMSRVVDFFELYNLTAIEEKELQKTPQAFELIGNFPNPFNNQTQIRFNLPAPGQVKLTVFNTPGQQVFEGQFSFTTSGAQKITFSGDRLASGLYFYRLIFNGQGKTFIGGNKMILIK
ncbi:T9SS type A sorting domain-containing protein [Calditrichota bacterium LG25]